MSESESESEDSMSSPTSESNSSWHLWTQCLQWLYNTAPSVYWFLFILVVMIVLSLILQALTLIFVLRRL